MRADTSAENPRPIVAELCAACSAAIWSFPMNRRWASVMYLTTVDPAVVIKEAGGRGIGLLVPLPVGIYRLLSSHLVLYRPVPVVAVDLVVIDDIDDVVVDVDLVITNVDVVDVVDGICQVNVVGVVPSASRRCRSDGWGTTTVKACRCRRGRRCRWHGHSQREHRLPRRHFRGRRSCRRRAVIDVVHVVEGTAKPRPRRRPIDRC